MFIRSQWDPVLIMAQIVVMQCLFMLCTGTIMLFVNALFEHASSLDLLFDADVLLSGTAHASGSIVALCTWPFVGSVCLVVVVQRAKKCLDFTSTLYIFYLLSCWIYGGFPVSWLWWLLVLAGAVIMTLLGEFLCMRVELREIKLGRGSSTRLVVQV